MEDDQTLEDQESPKEKKILMRSNYARKSEHSRR